MTGIFKIIFYGILIYLTLTLFRFFQAVKKGSRSPLKSKHSSGIMVKDEVCNTYLPKEDAIREIFEGKEYYFCSKTCRQKFLETKKPH